MLGVMVVKVYSQKADDFCDFFNLIIGIFCDVPLVKVELPEIEIEIVVGILEIFELCFISIEDADGIIIFDSSPSVKLHFSPCVHSLHAGPFVKPSPGLPQLLLQRFPVL